MGKTNKFVRTSIISTLLLLFLFFLTGDVPGRASNGRLESEKIESQASEIGISDAKWVLTPSPTPTPSPEPTPIPVYIPEFSDIPDTFLADTMTTTREDFEVIENEIGFVLSWALDIDADYFLLCLSYNGAEYHPFQILSPSVFQWEYNQKDVAGFLLIAYRDHGLEGMDDDDMLQAMRSIVFTPEITPDPDNLTAEEVVNAAEKYKIIVDKEDCAFGIFEKDEDGAYTVQVALFPAALGGSKTPLSTEKRQFSIGRKIEWRTWTGFDPNRYSPYASEYSRGVFFHGPIYRRRNFNSLLAYSYNDIGSNYKTGGCVRTTVAGARFVYYLCPVGTVVEVVSTSDLVSYPGKPEIDPDFLTWDPTDPQKPMPTPIP